MELAFNAPVTVGVPLNGVWIAEEEKFTTGGAKDEATGVAWAITLLGTAVTIGRPAKVSTGK